MAEQMNWQLRKAGQQTTSKLSSTANLIATKWTISPKTVTTNMTVIGKKPVQFVPKTTNSSSTKAMRSIQNLTHTVATVDVKDDEEIVIVSENDEVILTEDEIGNISKIPLRRNWVMNDFRQICSLCEKNPHL